MSRGREHNEEQEFLKDVDRMLAGEEIISNDDISEEYGPTIEFARKLSELHEGPSPEFRERLKSRLLLKLTEQNVEARARAAEPAWFNKFFSRLIPHSPVMRTAAVTIVIVLAVAGIVWQAGVFTPAATQDESEPIVMDIARNEEESMEEAAAPPPLAMEGEKLGDAEEWQGGVSSSLSGEMRIETEISSSNVTASLVGTRFSAVYGSSVVLELAFINTANETVTVSAPGVSIIDSNGLTIRTIPASDDPVELPTSGNETVTIVVVWDQKDDSGSQVTPGYYNFKIDPIVATRGTESINIQQPPVKVQVQEP